MENRIDKLVKKGLSDPLAFEKELDILSNEVSDKPAFKDKLYKEFKDSLDRKGAEIEQMAIKAQIAPAIDVINLSYIAKTYFSKSRQWLVNRVNGNLVNGKTAKFTKDELNTFNAALQDISKKIGSVSVYVH
ncbi:MAG: DUF5053 domain-containing protein [Chitinophagaceae bacterium]